jgi:hypothetical protein
MMIGISGMGVMVGVVLAEGGGGGGGCSTEGASGTGPGGVGVGESLGTKPGEGVVEMVGVPVCVAEAGRVALGVLDAEPDIDGVRVGVGGAVAVLL